MVYIKKGHEPNDLLIAKKRGLCRYDELHSDVKNSIKAALFSEQKGLCAYCMRRLNRETMQIEHYIPQHDQQGNYTDTLSIDYNNMLGVCPGGKDYDAKEYEEFICDQHRGNEKLVVDPRSKSSVSKIKYNHKGFIYSDDADINHDLNVTLNLNCTKAHLPNNRLARLEQFREMLRRKYPGKTITNDLWEKYLNMYLAGNKQGLMGEYAGIVIKYIEGKLGI